MYEDETLVCRDCGQEFVFSASEQAFFAEKGFMNKPSRCPKCRAARRAQNGNGSSAPRELRQGHPGALPAPWRPSRALP